MKKLFISISLALTMSASVYAMSYIPLTSGVNYEDGNSTGHTGAKAPVRPITIGIDGHTLYIGTVSFDCELQIRNENDGVVYSTYLFANTPTLEIPATLVGDYEIRLIDNERFFYGFINL